MLQTNQLTSHGGDDVRENALIVQAECPDYPINTYIPDGEWPDPEVAFDLTLAQFQAGYQDEQWLNSADAAERYEYASHSVFKNAHQSETLRSLRLPFPYRRAKEFVVFHQQWIDDWKVKSSVGQPATDAPALFEPESGFKQLEKAVPSRKADKLAAQCNAYRITLGEFCVGYEAGDWLDRRTAPDILDKSIRSVENYIKNGQLFAVYVGPVWFIHRAWV